MRHETEPLAHLAPGETHRTSPSSAASTASAQPPVPATPDESAGLHPLRRGLLPYARRHRRALGRGLLFTTVLVGCRLALPLPLGAAVEHAPGASQATNDLAFAPGWADPVTVLAAVFVLLA